jgi:RNA polymerase sigma-B factor
VHSFPNFGDDPVYQVTGMTTPTQSQKQDDAPEGRDRSEGVDAFRRLRLTQDPALRDAIVCEHLPLVYKAARRFYRHGVALDDLIQEGSIGLLKAVDLYDPELGVAFSTYATHLITGQIQHYLRDCGHLIRQPAWVQELHTKIMRGSKQLFQELQRDPTPAEIAERLNLTEDSVNEVLASLKTRQIVSLTVPTEEGSASDLLVIDRRKIHQKRYETLRLPIEDRIVLEEMIDRLKAIEQRVVRLFFFGEMNLSEIARRLGISSHYSSYLLRRSLQKIKDDINEQEAEEASIWRGGTDAKEAEPKHDSLPTVSGLLSLQAFQVQLLVEVGRVRRQHRRGVLVLIQLIAADTATEGPADPPLLHVARSLRQATHIEDVVGYLGNGLFGVIHCQVGADPLAFAGRLEAMLTPRRDMGIVQQPYTVHTGVAVFPDGGITAEALLKQAGDSLARRTTSALSS